MKEENTMTTEERAAVQATEEQAAAQAEAEATSEEAAPASAQAAEEQVGETQPSQAALPAKFRSVAALVQAYEALEAEFTRRSQRLRALEQAKKAAPLQGTAEERPSPGQQGNGADSGAEKTCSDTVMNVPGAAEGAEKPGLLSGEQSCEYSFRVPLMTHKGAGVTAPAVRPNNFEEAGRLALGYLRSRQKGETV